MTLFYWLVEMMATFMEILMCNTFCGIFIDREKLSKNKYLLLTYSVIITAMVIICNRIQFFSYLTSIIAILLCIVMQWIFYRRKYIISAFGVMFCFVLMGALDFITIFFVSVISKTSAEYLMSNQSNMRVICIIFSKVFWAILVFAIYKLMGGKKQLPKREIIVTLVCSLFLFISNFVMVEMNLKNQTEEMSMFSIVFFISSLGIELFLFYFIFQLAESYNEKRKLELVKMNNQMLKKSLDDTEQAFKLWRSSIHDYKNVIFALNGLAEKGDIEGIKEYLRQENDLVSKKMFYIKTGNAVVDTIVNTKQSLAEQKGINLVVNAFIPEESTISDIDMATLLGNLLDNALEAEIGEENPYVTIDMKQKKSFFVIKVKNKFTREFKGVDETSKNDEEFHGIGMHSVREIVDRYDGELSIRCAGDEVIIEILMMNGKK